MKSIRDLAESLVAEVSHTLDDRRVVILGDFLLAEEFEKCAVSAVKYAIELKVAVDGPLIEEFNEYFGAHNSSGVRIKEPAEIRAERLAKEERAAALSSRMISMLAGHISAKALDFITFYDDHSEWELAIWLSALDMLRVGMPIPNEVLEYEEWFDTEEFLEVKSAIEAQNDA